MIHTSYITEIRSQFKAILFEDRCPLKHEHKGIQTDSIQWGSRFINYSAHWEYKRTKQNKMGNRHTNWAPRRRSQRIKKGRHYYWGIMGKDKAIVVRRKECICIEWRKYINDTISLIYLDKMPHLVIPYVTLAQ